jgi:hypothetical protein
MTNIPELQRFREISWKRPLTAAEQTELETCLKANRAAREEWESDTALTVAMDGLADPAISSNFTARVLQAIERQDRAAEHAVLREPWWRKLARRTALAWSGSVAALLLIAGLLLHQQHVQTQHEFAKQEAVLAKAVLAVPNAEVLANFDTIRAMSAAPAPDEQLLAVLQ